MKIYYIGNFQPSHSTENHLARSLRLFGVEVVEAQENGVLIDDMLRAINQGNFDCVLYTQTWGLGGAGPAFMEQVKAKGIPTIGWHLDLWVGLDREWQLDSMPFWKCDHIFSPDFEHANLFKLKGIDHHWMLPGVLDEESRIGNPKDIWKSDIIFMGTYTNYHKEWPYRKQLVSWLQRQFPDQFVPWGEERGARGLDLNDVYASAKIVIGDSIKSNGYASDRLTETLGRGGFMIYPYNEKIAETFIDGEHLVYYHYENFDELREKIRYYLEHEEEREKIRQQGFDFVKRNHTYTNRAKDLIDFINGLGTHREIG